MEDIIKKGRNRNMSKMYQRYLEFKKINPNQIYLFKSGIFYLFLADDAKNGFFVKFKIN